MILECIATGLLACGIAFNNTHVNNDNHYAISDNYISESISLNYASNSINRVSGLYNFKDEINFYNFFNNKPSDYYYYTEVWFDHNKFGLCPISFGNQELEFVTILSIEIQAGPVNTIYLNFATYDRSNNDHSYSFYLDEIVDLDDLDYPYLFFNYSNSLTLSSIDSEIFNLIFTHDDNENIVSYTGYYNFLVNSSLRDGDKFSVLGSVVYNNTICNALYFSRSGTFSNVYYVNYDVPTGRNVTNVVTFETFRSVPNTLFNGVKMQVDTYNELSQIGVFSYVRDTQYDNTDFHDLLFTIMDTPIYFFSRLFDFQFFGVNLYIALSGLITLAVLVIIIRKIW